MAHLDQPRARADRVIRPMRSGEPRSSDSTLRWDRIDVQNFFSGESMNKDLMVIAPRADRWPGLIEVATIVLWGGLSIAFGIAWLSQRDFDEAGSVVARCDRLAQAVSGRSHAAHDAQWRRERSNAFESCLQDPDVYAHSQSVQ